MSQWDIDYHRGKLERDSGRKWIEASESLGGVMAEVASARIAVNAITFARRILMLLVLICIGCILTGIVGGVLGLFVASTVCALVLPELFLLGGAGWTWVWMGISLYPSHASRLAAKEAACQKMLEASIE